MFFIEKEKQSSVQSKKQKTASTKHPSVDEKYQAVANLNYVRSAEARKELMGIIDEFMAMPGLLLKKTSGHDLSVRYKGRQMVKICPLKRRWSASVLGGKIQSYTREQLLTAVRNELAKKAVNPQEEKVIKVLEERIGKMSKGSKGISVKGLSMSKSLRSWIDAKGYRLSGDLLLIS